MTIKLQARSYFSVFLVLEQSFLSLRKMFPGTDRKLIEKSSSLIGCIFVVSVETDFYFVIWNENGVAVMANAIVFLP